MAARSNTGRRKPASRKPQTTQTRRRRTPQKKKKKIFSWAVIFWLIFAIFIFGFFLFNRESISRGIDIVRRELSPQDSEVTEEPPVQQQQAAQPAQPAQQPGQQPGQQPAQQQPAQQAPALVTVPPPASEPPAQQSPAAALTQERFIYFIQVDQRGNIQHSRVQRRIPASDSPITDVLVSLIAGPNLEEMERGMMSLIPPGTNIHSAVIRGNTAVINFNSAFQFNTFGAEGYHEQIRQVVFTATELPNINDVQILIENRQIDYIGEGIWIGSPLSRSDF